MVKVLIFLIGFTLITFIEAAVRLDKLEIKSLDPSKGTAEIKIHDTTPKSVDVEVHVLADVKDLSLRIGAFSLIDGKYNEVIETETFSICDMDKNENPLISFVYKEMAKSGNLTTQTCPIKKGFYHLNAFTIHESDVPVALPPGNFKIEVNGTMHFDDGKDHLVFVTDIYFKETPN